VAGGDGGQELVLDLVEELRVHVRRRLQEAQDLALGSQLADLLHHRLEVLVRLLLARALRRVAGLMRKPRMASLMASMSKRISSALCSTVSRP
jgi:hypothetical protein